MNWKRPNRALGRFALLFAACVNLGLTFIHPAWSWSWWLSVTAMLFPLGCLAFVEWTWHRAHRPPTMDERLEMASRSLDPLGAMNRMRYLDTLSREQVSELVTWMREQAELNASWDLDDVPPVVGGFIKAGLPPEALRDEGTE